MKSYIDFFLSFLKFNLFCFRNNLLLKEFESEKKEFIILISPWDFNPVPWFSITIGLLLLKRQNKITYILDDLIIGKKINFKFQLFLIKITLLLNKNLNYVKLSTYIQKRNLHSEEIAIISKLAFANAVHTNRGEDNNENFKNLIKKYENIFTNNYSIINSCILQFEKINFIVPGGIYGNTGIFVSILNQINVNYFTFDSGFSVLMSTNKGISAQFKDVAITVKLISDNLEETEFSKILARTELEKRISGTNKLKSQYQDFENSEKIEAVGFLIPLNSPWDSAALNITTIFKSYNDWLMNTISLILKYSTEKITIRQHPDERHWWGRTSTDFLNLVINEFGNNVRIKFISCFDKVNTYALLNEAKAVICYSSTFGIESVIKNIPVCVCSSVYYTKLNFTYNPKSIEELIDFIKNSNLGIIKNNSEIASITYYAGQKCNWLFTEFTPMTDDFNKWSKYSIDQLLLNEDVSIYLDSLEKDLPLSFLVHKRYFDKFSCNQASS